MESPLEICTETLFSNQEEVATLAAVLPGLPQRKAVMIIVDQAHWRLGELVFEIKKRLD